MRQGTGMEDLSVLDRESTSNVLAIPSATLTIIIPTLNERDNIEPLVTRLMATLPDVAWRQFLSMTIRRAARPTRCGHSRAPIREYGVCKGSGVAAWLQLVSRGCSPRLRLMWQ